MEKVLNNPFLQKKKISLDIDKDLLGFVDKLAALTKASRTFILETTIAKGYNPLIESLKISWETLLRQDGLPKGKKENLNKLLKGLQKLSLKR